MPGVDICGDGSVDNVSAAKEEKGKFPTGLKANDMLSIVLRSTRTTKLFIVSGLYESDSRRIYGVFHDELGDIHVRILQSEDVIEASRNCSSLLIRIIEELNSARKRIARIERNLGDLLK